MRNLVKEAFCFFCLFLLLLMWKHGHVITAGLPGGEPSALKTYTLIKQQGEKERKKENLIPILLPVARVTR